MKFTKKQQGAISVFLSLILLSTFIFSAVIVDGGRIYAAKNIVSGAGQLSLNAGLSSYDVALKDAYGLIAMSETPEELQENLRTYFVESLGACGISEEDFNTALVFLQMAASEDGFSAEGIDNTQICQSQVMEQQVLEYMKYRAPITVGTGILDKLQAGKEIEEAQKVADDEVETAKEANDLQSQLEKLKKQVDDEIENSDDFSKTWESTLKEIQKLCKEITTEEMVVFGYNQYNTAKSAGDYEENINEFNAQYAKLVTAMQKSDKVDRYSSAYDIMLEMKGYYLTLKDVSESEFMDFWKEKYEIDDDSDDSEESSEDSSDEDEEEDDGDDELLEEGENLYEEYEGNRDYLLNLPSTIAAQADTDLKAVQTKSEDLYDSAEKGRKQEEKICKQIEKIEKKFKKLKEKYDKWNTDVKALSNAELKSDEEKKMEEYAIFLDDAEENSIDTMKQYAINNQDFYTKFKEYIDTAQFCNVKLRKVYYQKNSVKSEIDTHSKSNGPAIKSFVESTNFYYLLPIADPNSKFDHEPLKDLSKTGFYKYLVEVCGKEKDSDGAKSANKELQNQMKVALDELEKLFTSSDLESVAYNLNGIQDTLPSTMMGKGSVATEKKVTAETADIGSSSKRDKSMENALDALNTDNSTISGIASLASKGTEAMIEPIYLTEYIMNMYSYYTIDKTGERESDGSWGTRDEEEILSLSDYKLYEDLIYRAEVEYILWGNKQDVKTNVNTTKAVIFAIQFVGNLVYALTQPTVTKGAKEIGDLFGHKLVALVVQVVVEVVVATVETVRDMVILMNGGEVVMFKMLSGTDSRKEWNSKLEHMTDFTKWDMTQDKSSDNKLAMSYKDYLWMMVCIKNLSKNGRYDMLARAADLAQVNVAKSENEEGYSLMEKYTMLKIDANVELDAWLVTDLFNTDDVGLDTSGKLTLKYKGIQGY